MARLAVVVALVPIVVAAGRAVRDGWMPVWDNAYPAIRARDVLSVHPPLLGTRSNASDLTGRATNHPGPIEFVVLAPWVRLFGMHAGTVVGVAAVNLSAVAGVAWLAFRRGGHLTVIVAMAATTSLVWSLGSELLIGASSSSGSPPTNPPEGVVGVAVAASVEAVPVG